MHFPSKDSFKNPIFLKNLMAFKFIISDNGKAYRIETEAESLVGKNVGDVFDGKDIMPELEGYQIEITGGSDIAGIPLSKNIEGIALKGVLLTKGFGMRSTKKGLRLRKSLRGKQISTTTVQINMKVIKAGKKPIAEVFPDQNKPKEEAKPVQASEAAQTA